MANDVEGSASIRIEPDMSGFETTLLNELRSVLDTATDQITASFKDAASQAAEALGTIGDTGFATAATAADDAGASITASFAGTAEQATSDLAGIGEGAGDSVAASFEGVAGSIESSISDAASSADASLAGIGAGVSVDIPVTLDTSDAEQEAEGLSESLGGVGGSATAATDDLASLTGGTDALSSAASIGAGNISGLQGLIGGLSPAAKVAGGAIAGVATILGTFAAAGTKSIESQEQFNQTFGEFGSAIEKVNVGSLTGDLGDLTKSLGTSKGELRDVATDIGQFGIASGNSQKEVANTVEQVVALALGLRGLNPRLGSAGEIADRLTGALARGGRSAGALGIGLTSAEIATRAVEDGFADSADQLTQFDKLMAGAEITAERLGATLGKDVADGSDKLSVRWDKLRLSFSALTTETGKKVAIPVLELMESLVPIGIAVGTVVGDLAVSLTPVLSLMKELAGPVGAVAGAIAALNPDVIGLAGGLVAVAAGAGAFFTAFTTGIAVANPVIAGFLATAGLVVAAVSAFNIVTGKAGREAFAQDVKDATSALEDQNGVLQLTIQSVGTYIDESSRFSTRHQTDDLIRLGKTAEQVAVELSGGAKGFSEFVSAAEGSGEITRVFDDGLGNLTDSLGKTVRSTEGLREVNGQLFVGNTDLIKSFEHEREVLQSAAGAAIKTAEANHAITKEQARNALAADDQIGAYSRLRVQIEAHDRGVAELTKKYQPFVDAVTSANGALGLLEQENAGVADNIRGLGDGVGNTNLELVGLATNLDKANLSEAGMAAAAAALGTDVDHLKGFVEGVTGALDDFSTTAAGALPTVADAFKKLGDDDVLSPREFINNLNTATGGMASFLADLKRLTDAGFANIAGEIAKQGPEIGGGLADSLVTALDKGNTLLVSTADKAVKDFNSQWTLNVQYLQTVLGPQFILQSGLVATLASTAFGDNLDFTQATTLATGLAGLALDAGGQAVVAIAFSQGTKAATQYGVGVAGMTPATVQAALDAGAVLIAQGPGLRDAGWGAGADVVDGMDAGVRARMKVLVASLQKTGRDMIAVVKVTIDAQSPSREFMKIGHMVTDGLALGIDQGGRDVVAAAEAITRAAVSSSQDIFDRIGAAEGTTGLEVRWGGGGTLTDESARLRQQLADSGGPAFSLNGATPAQSFTVGSMPITVQVSGDVSDARAREIGTVVGDAAHQRMLALVDREVTAETRLAGL